MSMDKINWSRPEICQVKLSHREETTRAETGGNPGGRGATYNQWITVNTFLHWRLLGPPAPVKLLVRPDKSIGNRESFYTKEN